MQITKEGKAVSRIILGKYATWLETHAAEELQRYIEQLSGARLLLTYEQDAGSFPTNTTANPGVTPVRSFNVSTFVLISARIFEANALPSII